MPVYTLARLPGSTWPNVASQSMRERCNWERKWSQNRSLAQTDEVVLHVCYGGVVYWMLEGILKPVWIQDWDGQPLILSNGATFFVVRTLGKVDSAGRATLLPRITFLHITGLYDLYKCSNFFTYFQEIGRSTWMQRSKFGRLIPHFGRTLPARFDVVETTSSLCVLLEIHMSNNRNVSKYRGSVRWDFTRECIFSVFGNMLPKKTDREPNFLNIVLWLLIGLCR